MKYIPRSITITCTLRPDMAHCTQIVATVEDGMGVKRHWPTPPNGPVGILTEEPAKVLPSFLHQLADFLDT